MRKIFAALAAIPMFLAPAVSHAQGVGAMGSAYDHTFMSIDGKELPLSSFKGQVVLVVNTASFCGYTKQYAGLQALYEKYSGQGLVVLGVPSNDFGEQEPGTAEEIQTFCQGAFGVTFPLTEKVKVKGADAHPFYQWAAKTLGPAAAPSWNFHKYLIGRDGRLISAFNTRVSPEAPEIARAVEAAMAAVPPA